MTQGQALAVMLSGNSVFLTGSPGAGKTYTLNTYIRRAKNSGVNVAVTASTGIAATHIGGTTIHSWSGLGIRDSLSDSDRTWLAKNDRLRKRYLNTDVLVIDEVSMLHGQRLDMVSEACKILRKSDKPFGGLQVILVGDLFQLPPINRYNEEIDFAHNSAVWSELKPKICYLTEQHRQAGGGLLDVLEAMRTGEMNEHFGETLTSRMDIKPDDGISITRLYSHNMDVDSINNKHLKAIDEQTKTFEMHTKGAKVKVEQLVRSVLAPEILELKIGAEVMFVANNFGKGFVNGSRGTVVDFKEDKPLVQLNRGHRIIEVEPHSWTLQEDGSTKAEVSQLPLRLAWAITIHKSQGMSLDAAEIDLSRSFTPGMGYVALSRIRSLDGLYLIGLNPMALQMHSQIFEFDVVLRQASLTLANQTDEIEDEVKVEQKSETAKQDTVKKPKRAINFDKNLFEELRIWRLERARNDKVSPFIVAHNTLLQEISARPPANKTQLFGIKGMGEKKIETYGDDILKITKPYVKK